MIALKKIGYFLAIGFTAAVCALIVQQVASQWRAIISFPWRVQSIPLILSAFVLLAVQIGSAAVWVLLARSMAIPLRLIPGIRIFFVSSLGKYLPGKIWTLISTASMGRREGLGGTRLASSMLYYAVLHAQAGLLLALLGASWIGSALNNHMQSSAVILIAVCCAGLFFFPAIFSRTLHIAFNIFRREHPDVEVPFVKLFTIFLLVLIVWMFELLGYWLLIHSYYDAQWTILPELLTAWAFSSTVGFLAVFMPSGLGARDGTLLLLLERFMPSEVASVSVLAFRAWGTLLELGLTAVLLGTFLLTSNREQAKLSSTPDER